MMTSVNIQKRDKNENQDRRSSKELDSKPERLTSAEKERKSATDKTDKELQPSEPAPLEQRTVEDDEAPVKPHESKTKRHLDKRHPMLPYGTLLRNKYELKEVIGAGGYGQIYKCIQKTKGTAVAVKVMKRRHEPQRMILEQRILYMLKGKPNFPELIASGQHEQYLFIVMELLGNSLSELRKRSTNKRFDPPTAIRVGQQVLKSLQVLHTLGFVHRDIKPGNMCIGLNNPKQIYVVDFGLARQFRDKGKVKRRGQAKFRGTVKYVSINVHNRRDQNPCDDLIALFYSISEMGDGDLPWSRLRDPEDITIRKKMATEKNLCRRQPSPLWEFYQQCYECCEDPNQPNYEFLNELLCKCLPTGCTETTPMSYELLPPVNTSNKDSPCDVDDKKE